jgi:hypothetical protein
MPSSEAFFIVFSYFKVLNIRGFADSYRTYEIVANGFPAYGYLYPFIELTLGVCYLSAFAPLATNLANCAVTLLRPIAVTEQKRRAKGVPRPACRAHDDKTRVARSRSFHDSARSSSQST